MNELRIFENTEFGELGVIEIDGKVFFPATKCAKALGYKEPEKAIRDHCKGVSVLDSPSAGGMQRQNFIPEGDLYRLIISSRLPAAERFEKWIFDEVIPTIRKTGGYGTARTSLGDVVRMMETARDTLKAQGATPREVAIAIKEIADQYGIKLPDFFVKPETFTLNDAISMVDFVYSHVGKQPPTYQDFVAWRIQAKQLPHRERRMLT